MSIVFRLVAGTLRESVFSQIQWEIDTLGVSHLWKSKVSPMQFEYVSGAQIVFRGLDDALKLKSIKPKKGSFAFIWFEEFSELPGELLLRSVQQSVMRGRDDFIVFRSFNPPISANNRANMYIRIPDEKSITLLTDYTMIPHCLTRMDKTQWERLIDAYFTFAEVNKNFRKYHMDRGEPLFQVELLTEKKYVKPEKIVLDDGFAGQTGAGTSMEEALMAMDKPFADIVRSPVPNRDIADYE